MYMYVNNCIIQICISNSSYNNYATSFIFLCSLSSQEYYTLLYKTFIITLS